MFRWDPSLEQVQRWVITFLIMAVSSFPLGAMTAAVSMLEDDRRGADAVLLLVVMGVLGILALAAIRLVHKRSPLTAWLSVGLLPSLAAATWVFVL